MPILQPDQIYQLLRNLTSPVVAITSERGGTRNGMIADSAVRASIVPAIPRVSVYIHKFNYSHDLIFESGRFVLHLLRDDQFELIHQLRFASGRHRGKPSAGPDRAPADLCSGASNRLRRAGGGGGKTLGGPPRRREWRPSRTLQNARQGPPLVGLATHPLRRFHTKRRRPPRIPPNRLS